MKLKSVLFIFFGICGVILFQNCTKSVHFTEANPDLNSLDQPSQGSIVDLVKKCQEEKNAGRIKKSRTQLVFENPNKQCEWNNGGNLERKEGLAQARSEQHVQFQVTGGAHVCDVELVNIDVQDFFYDDNIILTLNGYILASTTNFNHHFESNSGYFKYDWLKLRGKNAQAGQDDSILSRQYCAGKELGLSTCSFPQTSTYGNIQINIHDTVLQNILQMTSSRDVSLGLITTGDNDDSDCQHVPVRFNIDVSYF